MLIEQQAGEGRPNSCFTDSRKLWTVSDTASDYSLRYVTVSADASTILNAFYASIDVVSAHGMTRQ